MNNNALSPIRRFINILGYALIKNPRIGNRSYCLVTPRASYNPWNVDNDFIEFYNLIKKHTIVDVYRCYELWQLVEQSAKLSKGAFLEVGTWRGGTGSIIVKQARLCGIQDNVYLCDTFNGVVKVTDKDSFYNGGEHDNTKKNIVEKLFDNLNLTNIQILEGIFPEETSHLIKDNFFRFCHIDVDVYKSALDVTNWIWNKLVIGGFIVYDDYGFDLCDGVRKMVDEQRNKKDRIVIHNLNGHAIIIKIE